MLLFSVFIVSVLFTISINMLLKAGHIKTFRAILDTISHFVFIMTGNTN